MKTNNKGFSLVELIVVIAIMAILAAIAIPTFATFINKANEASDIDFMNNVEYAAKLAYAGEGKEFTKVEVILSEDQGTVSSVKVYVADTDGQVEEDFEVKKTGNTDEDQTKQEMMELIAGTIDWDYKFKAKKTNLVANKNWKTTEWVLSTASEGDAGEQP